MNSDHIDMDIDIKRRTLLAGALSSLAALSLPAFGQHSEGHRHGEEGKGKGKSAGPARPELGMSAAFDHAGVLWIAFKEAEGETSFIALRRSADAGKTWSASKRIASVKEAVAASGESRPKIAFGHKGEILVAYTKPIARPHIGDIRFVRSLDGGETFSAPVTVHANRDVITHSFESMIVDPAGRIYVAWVDGRDAEAAKARKEKFTGSSLYYAVSEDGGASFRGDFKIADHCCECCRISLALDPQGRPVAFWRHVFAPNVRDHALSVLAADGKPSPVVRATFDDWRIDACPHHGPGMAFSPDGRRHQVWFNGREGESGGVHYATAGTDGSLSRPAPVGSAQAAHADIVVQGRNVAIAWRQFDGQSMAIHARASADGGQSWKESVLARTAGESGKPALVAGADGIVMLWRTQNEGVIAARIEGTKT